jgi:hydrogenase expression/formation protein HypC
MEKAAVGDYVIIHAGFAIEKVDTKRAEETLRLIREAFEK